MILENLLLINAVYFKGRWTEEFDKTRTGPSPFFLASGTRIGVDTLAGDIRAGLHSTPDVLVGELPYAGRAFAMDVVMPHSAARLDGMIADLNAHTWAGWMAGLPKTYARARGILVRMPRLTLRTHNDLHTALTSMSMGMGIAFDPDRADLSRMVTTPPGAHVGSVVQDTYVKVDEEGTTAAAVTTRAAVAFGVGARPVPFLIVDRPSMLVIRERSTGLILFIGAITDPGEAQ